MTHQTTTPPPDAVPSEAVPGWLTTLANIKPPKWCRQLTQWPKDCRGAKGDSIVEGYDLALEALGERVHEKNSSLIAFGYLYRRFGPPALLTDEQKKLSTYVLCTPMKGVYLAVDTTGGSLRHSIAYRVWASIQDQYYAPEIAARKVWFTAFQAWYKQQPDLEQTPDALGVAIYHDEIMARAVEAIGRFPRRKSREEARAEGGTVAQINDALIDCLRELLRPVRIDDASINLFGYLPDAENTFKYAAAYYETPQEEPKP